MDSLSVTFAALACPARRQILEQLTAGSASVSQLAEPLAISQQAVSKHIACLERARLVTKNRRGRQHLCQLTPQALDPLAEWIENCRAFWTESFEQLEALIQRTNSKGD